MVLKDFDKSNDTIAHVNVLSKYSLNYSIKALTALIVYILLRKPNYLLFIIV